MTISILQMRRQELTARLRNLSLGSVALQCVLEYLSLL